MFCQKCEVGKALAVAAYRRPGFYSQCKECSARDEYIYVLNDRKVCSKCSDKFPGCKFCGGSPLSCQTCVADKFLLARKDGGFSCVECKQSNYFKVDSSKTDGTGLV